ncbi:hypothetical protein GOBAR_AA11853 [Gossypium barbadense]|uniref:Uncharacterized protein n=1 Tax=Gossypium barbadense TaxID=3634 RepID=A0A2P5XZT3_GOSBA|nr:hypothetical protein GOBAR_AA11853 [Gossypium barbadense]
MHLAAQAGVRYAMQNPGSYVHSNIAGFVNLLEVSKSANPQPAIIWASSSSVYGLNSRVPFSEKDRTDQPASLYAATKKAGEEIAHTYNHIYGLSITGLRFFTVYGPWGRPDMAYFFFTKDIMKGKTITVYESPDKGSVARDFTYIDDIVKGCLGALDTAKKSTGSGGKKRGPAQLRIFNLGNTSPVPVSRLVSILEKILKVKAKKKVVPLPRNGDVEFTHANITLAMTELGYKPTTDLEAGLKKFMNATETLLIEWVKHINIHQVKKQDGVIGAYEKVIQQFLASVSESRSSTRLLSLAWEEVLNKGTRHFSEEFSQFCDRKMNEIVAMLGWNRAWPEPLLQAFFGASKSLCLVHLLANSVHPGLPIFRVDKGARFDSVYMEDMDGERAKKLVPSMVRILITPGFYVYGNVVKCKVICRYSNNVDSSLIDKGLTSSFP